MMNLRTCHKRLIRLSSSRISRFFTPWLATPYTKTGAIRPKEALRRDKKKNCVPCSHRVFDGKERYPDLVHAVLGTLLCFFCIPLVHLLFLCSTRSWFFSTPPTHTPAMSLFYSLIHLPYIFSPYPARTPAICLPPPPPPYTCSWRFCWCTLLVNHLLRVRHGFHSLPPSCTFAMVFVYLRHCRFRLFRFPSQFVQPPSWGSWVSPHVL